MKVFGIMALVLGALLIFRWAESVTDIPASSFMATSAMVMILAHREKLF